MTIRMRALTDFRGRHGEGNGPGNDRMVEAGPDFTVADQARADDLQRRGLAIPLPPAKTERPHLNKMESTLENKAAAAGPLPLTGGRTGAGEAASSSPADLVPPKRVSPKRLPARKK